MKKRVVVALGHRALGTTLPDQKLAVNSSAVILADLVEEGAELIITHSNAPQVGMIHTAMNEYAKAHETYGAPMSVCSAMSQGYIGYDIQNALRAELLKRGIYKTVSTVLTQVTVDPYDETFYHPTKVIGRYMTAEEAALEQKKGNYVVEEPGKGFRRIIASPKPIDIVEIEAINALSDAGQIVIACGGGGIPVLKQGSNLKGASAVIEKDLVSGLLADLTDADMLMILTNEEFVNIKYGTDKETPLKHITPEEARVHIANHEFGETKMLPKIEASINFVSREEGRTAVITSIDKAVDAYRGKTGTVICEK
ncbi:MAG: carbamate kinase [Lachnospiraceae bacterium]